MSARGKSAELAAMTGQRARKIIERLRKFYGMPSPDLHFGSLYQLTIAVILSAQTTDRQVNEVTPVLFSRYPGFDELAVAKIEDVEEIIRSTGFYRNKAKNIVALARVVREKYNGELPSDRERLMELPGVGRKSANVILSVGFGIPAFAVDTHILRLAKRIGFTGSGDPRTVEEAVTSRLPAETWRDAHLLLIWHGRRICTARGPRCPECPVNGLCDYAKSVL